MSLFHPRSVIYRPGCNDAPNCLNSQSNGVRTEETTRQEVAKPYLPYMYNSYDQVHRQSSTARRNSGRPLLSRDITGRYKGQVSNNVRHTPPPTSLDDLASTTRSRRPQRGLLMLVQPKSGQGIESFTVQGFHRATCDVVGHGLVSSRLTARGGLLVEVTSASAARRLLRTETLCGVAVDVQVPRSDQHNVGLIRGVTKWYTDEEVADQLSSQGVVQARRIRTRARDGDQAAASSQDNVQPTDKVVLVFMPHEERPRYVTLDAVEREVEEYRPETPQCFECQRMGHVARHCPFNIRCARCGGPHPTVYCDQHRIRCANCGQGHRATYRLCLARQRRLDIASFSSAGHAHHVVPNLQSVVQLPEKKRETDTSNE